MASLVLGDWFGSAVVGKLIDIGFAYLQNRFFLQANMLTELRKLKELHPRIRAIVLASSRVEEKGKDSDLGKWLGQLHDAVDQADDLLDELEYQELAKKVQKTDQIKVRITPSPLINCCLSLKLNKCYFNEDPTLKKLRIVVRRLDEAFAGAGNFLQLLESTTNEVTQQQAELYKVRETGSLPKTDMFGREREREFVLDWLKKVDDDYNCSMASGAMYSNISVLSVVGHGGMGKTTLAQHVYRDVAADEFDLKLWVCVSNSFDVKRLFSDMLESVTGRIPDLSSLNALQENLKGALMSKRFFLVLDDVWEEEKHAKSKWENVLAPLANGKEGSKVLVTTRMDSVALLVTKVMRKRMFTLKLEGLQEEDCLFLFNSYAFADVKNLECHHELKSIGRMVVKKLSGSPLAAKVIGGLLNSNLDVRHWNNVLYNDIGNQGQGQDDIMPILRLSYTYLPPHLQNCFAFCSIFPRDYEFDKDDLVRMWMSLGFIQQVHGVGEALEEIGGKYFDILVSKSIFEKVEDNHRNLTYYLLHDLLHDLAQSVSANACIRVVSDDKFPVGLPDTIRHLSVATSKLSVLREMKFFKNLRSLFITYYGENTYLWNTLQGDDQNFDLVLSQIIKASRSIRLLCIRAPHFKVMPKEIGDLIHLRFLKLIQTSISRLPRSVCNLYHLQVVVYEEMYQVSKNFLPKGMNNLPNLRHLILPWDEINGIPEIGKLSFLQEIDGFRIMDVDGCRIEELRNLNELRVLRIKLVENVKDAGEARRVNLKEKHHLMDLSIEWGDGKKCCEQGDEYWDDEHLRNDTRHDFDEQILDELQPHTNLRKLTVHGYIGVRSAIWMTPSFLSNLESIRLHKCFWWESLPALGQLPFLKTLDLSEMPLVKQLGFEFHGNGNNVVFRSLETFLIRKLEALEEWCCYPSTTEYHQCFPSLQKLQVQQCPKLHELPELPLNLMRLKITDVGLTSFPVHRSQCSNSPLSSLTEIEITGCRDITSLPSEDILGRFTALELLEISYCENLRSLGGLQAVHSLKRVAIWDCPNLVQRASCASNVVGSGRDTIVNFPFFLEQLETNDPLLLLEEPLGSLNSLHILKIMFNKNLISFPVEAENWLLQNCSSLQELHLWDVISLRSLPSCLNKLSSLLVLDVCHTPELRSLPQLPSSLQKLMITYCHPELKVRYQRDAGSDWEKIAHVPHVGICI